MMDEAYRNRAAADARLLRDIERMEHLMVEPRTWAHCDTCRKLRSSIVDGTCLSCRDALERGERAPRSVTPPPAAPVPAPVEPPAPEPDPHPEPAVVVDITPLADSPALEAEVKQRPVKRRWWKRTR